MMDQLHLKNPLYPILCIVASVVILFGGLLVSKKSEFWLVLVTVGLLWQLFGYGKVLGKCLLIFVPVGLVIGGFSMLVTTEWLTASQTAGRILLLGLAAIPLVSLPPVNLTRCLAQLHCPRTLTLGMLVTIRFTPILMDEIRQILEAMRTRGVRAVWYNPTCFYRAIIMPLVMRLIHISDSLSLSLETRGFVLGEKDATVYLPVPFTMRDGLFSATLLAMTMGMGVLYRL